MPGFPSVPLNAHTPQLIPPPRRPRGTARLSFARLLKRVFEIDIEQCPRCGGTLTILAAIENPS